MNEEGTEGTRVNKRARLIHRFRSIRSDCFIFHGNR
eukprot:CAMPEP_0195627814 /NCGR_PEP_ID=MMETSP0815-20121206/19125_1 /TAXON_ID=97485 /ORGANISM="Prymnesium parvum, Strain Texoma1" /LENGTH=35 /DNA_ID= /DNA_START= /DNA_END= /DNA_ORIENTATION=